jgi:N-acetyl-gamma-glutamyl-phosphate reductase
MSKPKATQVAIVGARGYSGAELARLALAHPQMSLAGVFATQVFDPRELLPELSLSSSHVQLKEPLKGQAMQNFEDALNSASPGFQTVFLATPPEVSLEWAPRIVKKGLHVIDLSGAFRLKGKSEADSKAAYAKWYGINHNETGLVQEADFGLVPFAHGLPNSGLISNPGCYATATSLGLIPLYHAGLVRLDTISVDAKSGTTGAGRKAEERLLHAEVDGGCLPYRIGRHQHEPEIAEAVARWGLKDAKLSTDVSFSFVPHLIPVRRGIIVSIHARLNQGVQEKDVRLAFESLYKEYPLARLLSLSESQTAGAGPLGYEIGLRRVVGSARTVLAWHVRGDQLIVITLIDNLLKGAASQAVENFNRLQGLNVETGLSEREGVL